MNLRFVYVVRYSILDNLLICSKSVYLGGILELMSHFLSLFATFLLISLF